MPTEISRPPSGRGLLPVIVALGQWAGGPQGRLVERKTGRRVRFELRSEGGRKVTAGDVRLLPATEGVCRQFLAVRCS